MELTRAEKVALVTGGSFWSTAAVERAGIPSVMIVDGPHGLRKQQNGGDHLGLGESNPATCFPPAVGLGSSFNVDLVERVGRALGDEARAENVAVLLGPGVNIKRSPLCGRNFEYLSEDPHVSGELGAAWVRGIQSRGVGASLKHFAVNNQETNRMTVSAEVDERTLREIYLPAFETIVKREEPWTVMCSYNRINGAFAAESGWLLTDLLRGEWLYEGLIISDWGAVDDRVAALHSGLDLEMPGPQASSAKLLLEGADPRRLDESAARVAQLARRASAPTDVSATERAELHDAHHRLAREAATESIVLLRNEGGVLPLRADQRIAVIGEFARNPRIQGAGSSQVVPTRVDSALDALAARAAVTFASGGDVVEAVDLARGSDVAVLFVGLPEGDESEGFDRTHLDLPAKHVELITAVAEVNPRTVVVLTNGGVVSLEPWHDSVSAIVEAWLLGQAGGGAIADVLLGTANPSGRLAETIPLRLQDNPSYLNFPGEYDVVRYGEGIFVGYRYYETATVPVRYPFGHGLSYTTFDYSDLEVDDAGASVRVTNTGDRAGAEVVQLYVAAPDGPVRTAVRELRGFAKVTLAPGESATVTIALDDRGFSYFDVESYDFEIAGGEYAIEIGRSSHDIVLRATVRRTASRGVGVLGLHSRVSEWLSHPVTGPIFRRVAAGESDGLVEGGTNVLDMVGSMPMRRLLRIPGVPVSEGQLKVLAALANNRVVRGVAQLFSRRP